jgi:hypothetical protein
VCYCLQQGSASKAKCKGLDPIVVKLSFEEVHVQSGHVLVVKSIHEQHERMQNTFEKMQHLQLEIALMSVQYYLSIYIYIEKHKLL